MTLGIAATLTGIVPTASAAAGPQPAIVIDIAHSKNGWGAEYSDGYDVQVLADGFVIVRKERATDDGAVTSVREFKVGERGVRRALREARRVGLTRRTDYGEAGITDQGTSTIVVKSNGRTRTTNVYALLMPEGDQGLTRAQREARELLRDFVHDATRRSFYVGS